MKQERYTTPSSIQHEATGKQSVWQRDKSLGKRAVAGLGIVTVSTVAALMMGTHSEAAPASGNRAPVVAEQPIFSPEQARALLEQVPGVRDIDPTVESIVAKDGTNLRVKYPAANQLDNLYKQLTADTVIETPGGLGEVDARDGNGEFDVYIDRSSGQAIFIHPSNVATINRSQS